MKYTVLYASVGLLSGHERGDVVDIADESDAAHLIGLGLVEPYDEKAKPEGQESNGLTEAEALKADQDKKLAPFLKGGGWYWFGEGDTLVKAQGRESALAQLVIWEAANVAGHNAERE